MRRFTEAELIIATHNRGKFAEFAALLAAYPVKLLSAGDLGLAEPRETETTFIGNARLKAQAAVAATGRPALADDSGICIEALGGAPGVYTADWAETPGGPRDFVKAMTRAWGELEALKAPFPRRAAFCCTLVLAWPDGAEAIFEGRMPGQITWPMRGSLGHGYDPIFQPEGYDITFGEMDMGLKNQISHRARAFDLLLKGCFT